MSILYCFITFFLSRARLSAASSWKCPAGQHGNQCTSIQISSSSLANANYVGTYTYEGQSDAACTGRSVYILSSNNKYLAYIHVMFWPYISSWMIFDTDPRNTAVCTNGVTVLTQLANMHVMLQTSDLTPAHRTDKTWKAKSNEALYDYDSTVSARCVQGCTSCPSGTHSRGCNRLTLNLDPKTFVYPDDTGRLNGTYERLGTGAGEHAVYARIKTQTPKNQPNIYDVYISYLWFATYSLNSAVVFEEGYCLQWDGPPLASMDLRYCQYIAKNPGSNPRLSDPATPATGPKGNQLVWSLNRYPNSPDSIPAPTMKFTCEECVSCPRGKHSHRGSILCVSCPRGYYSNEINQALCKSCPSGFHGIQVASNACSKCPNGKYSILENGQESGIAMCDDCLPGKYSTNSSDISCSHCPAGFYQEISGQSKCKMCPKGFYQETLKHSTSCFECLRGTYSALPATIGCSVCPSGFAQSSTGSSECLLCSKGDVSDAGSSKCTACGYLSYVATAPSDLADPMQSKVCVPCPSCTLDPIPCGKCDTINGFVQLEGFWNPNRTLPAKVLPSLSSASPIFTNTTALSRGTPVLPPPSIHEIFLKCDVIGFKIVNENMHSMLVRQEDTACHVNVNNSLVCKEGYDGFLCASCQEGFGHGSRKSTCSRCDVSLVGPWIRMITIVIVGMCIVAYIVKRKTRKQSASLERVGLL